MNAAAAAATSTASARSRAVLIAFVVALGARLAMVAWAGTRFPPAADGTYYHTLAMRLASGLGYTWAWPDGAVTPAAHYPVGYPALLSLLYIVFGATPRAAMILNAVVGSAGAGAAAHLARAWGERAALAAGLAVALHPSLVAYTPALMTEAIAGALLLIAVAAAAPSDALAGRRRALPLAIGGVVLGVATLVRPQCVLLAPVLGFVAARPDERPGRLAQRLLAAWITTAAALVVCLPWTLRNCHVMNRCALVSVNGGWNLLIGAQTQDGAWREISVPTECSTVWDEAAKDACFEHAARRELARNPAAALLRAPAKLAVTFDYFGGGPWYLHESNAAAFDDRAKLAVGAVDLAASRLLLIGALIVVTLRARKLEPGRTTLLPPKLHSAIVWVVALVALVSATLRHAAPAYLGLVVLIAFGAPYSRTERLLPWTAWVVASVAFTHAVFFGAGRYGLVVAPFVAAVAGSLLQAIWRPARDVVADEPRQ